MLEHNKARVRRYVEKFQSAGNVETADALVAADIIHHHGPGWTLVDSTGREGAKAFITMLRAAFPDLHAVIHDQFVQGDKVMTRKSFSGTHRGTFWGIPPNRQAGHHRPDRHPPHHRRPDGRTLEPGRLDGTHATTRGDAPTRTTSE